MCVAAWLRGGVAVLRPILEYIVSYMSLLAAYIAGSGE